MYITGGGNGILPEWCGAFLTREKYKFLGIIVFVPGMHGGRDQSKVNALNTIDVHAECLRSLPSNNWGMRSLELYAQDESAIDCSNCVITYLEPTFVYGGGTPSQILTCNLLIAGLHLLRCLPSISYSRRYPSAGPIGQLSTCLIPGE